MRLVYDFYVISPAYPQLSSTYLELGPAEACFLCMETIRSARSSPAGIRLGLEGPAGPGYDVISMASYEYWCIVLCAHYSGEGTVGLGLLRYRRYKRGYSDGCRTSQRNEDMLIDMTVYAARYYPLE